MDWQTTTHAITNIPAGHDYTVANSGGTDRPQWDQGSCGSGGEAVLEKELLGLREARARADAEWVQIREAMEEDMRERQKLRQLWDSASRGEETLTCTQQLHQGALSAQKLSPQVQTWAQANQHQLQKQTRQQQPLPVSSPMSSCGHPLLESSQVPTMSDGSGPDSATPLEERDVSQGCDVSQPSDQVVPLSRHSTSLSSTPGS